MTIRSGLSILVVTMLAASSVFIGCRPSQQARRGNTAKSPTSQTKTMDSLLMVQDKLITVVDTMASIIATDRRRILELEREVAKLKSLLEERAMNGGAVTPPQVTTPNSYNDRTVTGLPIPPPSQSSTLQPPEQPQVVSTPPQNDAYTAALKQFNSGNYTDALAAFDDLVHKDANSALAPNYLYWKGESLYALGEYNEAIRSFHDVLEQYPQSSKADDAEFKIGASYEKLGNALNAKTAYQRLMLSFPESEYRNRAEARIKKLQ